MEQAVHMEIPTETCTHDIKKMLIYSIISFVSWFFPDVSAVTPISVFSFCCCCFFYANVTVLMARVKYDRFLQVFADHVTIIWPVLF